ncbi:hypothetical protein QR680_016941 [Steinernema hermaphroditum]|uniref:G-protein coupled receptors family 1 profile domain-containing protein n=1 Tax=Steinernema hermaphroditum TaxID=289476 RepID=A0AA39HCT1_9BILA|nr:hypothetical protein QR680_016941 [Steinernema hermaphroditum]
MIKVSFSEYQRINRSINMIILVYVFGWLATMGGCFFALRVGLNSSHWEYTAIETTVGIFCNVNVAAPFFIYFFRSTAYRQEFSKLFKIRRKARSVVDDTRSRPNDLCV